MSTQYIQKKIIDFMPKSTMEGDLLKITDHRPAATNTKILALMNILEMEQNTLPEYPEAGGKNILMELYFCENPVAILRKLSIMVNTYIDLDVQFTYEKDALDASFIYVYATVTGLSGKIKFGLQNDGTKATIVEPSYVQ